MRKLKKLKMGKKVIVQKRRHCILLKVKSTKNSAEREPLHDVTES